MRLRNIFWVIVLNIFLMLFVSVLMEYNMLSNRMQQLENTVSSSVETALDTTMASEELFSEKYSSSITSVGDKLNSSTKSGVENKLRVYRDGNWIEGNAYVMSKYYNDNNGKFPTRESELSTYSSSWGGTDKIYRWLFGNIGSDFSSPSLKWANGTSKEYNNASNKDISVDTGSNKREPTYNMKMFYKYVGSQLTSKTTLKVKVDNNNYKVANNSLYYTMARMGLDFSKQENGRPYPYTEYNNNSVDSTVSHDDFHRSYHIGKAANGVTDSIYFLTPYSLGITYVPTEVYKPVFQAHLEQSVRFNKIKGGTDKLDSNTNLGSADGCIISNVYTSGSNVPVKHEDTSSKGKSNIINDGYVEYDLDSIRVKVDYKVIDFYDDTNTPIVERLLGLHRGAVEGKTGTDGIVGKLKKTDTSKGELDGRRVVARISTKMKVHIPYISPILQWFSYLESEETNKETHFGIKRWDAKSGNVSNSDDLWFKYTTYRAISR